MQSGSEALAAGGRLGHFVALTKPRVNALILFCVLIGMALAVPQGLPPLAVVVPALIGIGAVAGAAAAMNCLIEQRLDARMARTRGRPLPRGQLTTSEAALFAGVLGGLGLLVLWRAVNPLTMWLTLATFVGYALVYTVLLKPLTPQNIVIGGASGAMPPVLGWAAVTGEVGADALLAFLIIFAWTPPHFWSLALTRAHEYAAAGVPMLPVTHGAAFTRLMILLYTAILFGVSLLPFATGMSGWPYLLAALGLGGGYLHLAWRMQVDHCDKLSRGAFRYSIVYLSLTFAALLADHYLHS
ncbi:MAG: protoheme IX farnesyltransferase [Zoogloea sp.]|nr:protoheme IX farnesyltransferase [Zoogloea sp.]